MVSKLILVCAACFAVQSNAARTVAEADVDQPGSANLRIGDAVIVTSEGKHYNGVVANAPQVEIQFPDGEYQWTPLAEVRRQGQIEDASGVAEPEPEPAARLAQVLSDMEDDDPLDPGDEMNTLGKIVCDVCLRKKRTNAWTPKGTTEEIQPLTTTTCDAWLPTASVLNPVAPAPRSNGRGGFDCHPSDRTLWLTEDMVDLLPQGSDGAGKRGRCPVARERAGSLGKVPGSLTQARQACNRVLPTVTRGSDCSEIVMKEVVWFGHDNVKCDDRVYSKYKAASDANAEAEKQAKAKLDASRQKGTRKH